MEEHIIIRCSCQCQGNNFRQKVIQFILGLSLACLTSTWVVGQDTYAGFIKGGKYGIEKNGKKHVPAKYNSIKFFPEFVLVEIKGKYGVVEKASGKETVPTNFDNIEFDDYDRKNPYVRVTQEGKKGIYDAKIGTVIAPPIYESVEKIKDPTQGLIVQLNGKWGVVNEKNQEIIPLSYKYISRFYDNYKVNISGLIGMIDKSNKLILPAKYSDVISYESGFFIVQLNGFIGLVDGEGKEIIPITYKKASDYRNPEFIKVQSNPNTKFIIELKTKSGEIVYFNEKGSRVDQRGNPIKIPISDDIFVLTKEGEELVGLQDKNGKVILKPTYTDIKSAGENAKSLAIATLEGKLGLVDISGKTLIAPKFDFITNFSKNGYAKVNIGQTRNQYNDIKKPGKWGLIDKTGKEIIPCEYDYVFFAGENWLEKNILSSAVNIIKERDEDEESKIIIVLKEGKYGILDKKGKLLIAPKFDFIESFNKEGFAITNIGGIIASPNSPTVEIIDGKFGIIDKTGKEIVECKYNFLYNFGEDGYANASTEGKMNYLNGKIENGKWGLIDKKGIEIIPCMYDECLGDFPMVYDLVQGNIRSKEIRAKLNGKWGMIDRQNKVIVPFEYAAIDKFFSQGLLAVSNEEGPFAKWGFVDRSGKLVIPMSIEVDEDFQSPPYFRSDNTVSAISGYRNYVKVDKTGKIIGPDEDAKSYRNYLDSRP